jgi:ubiquitin carboxyl-terminal hydrolase L3
MASGTVYKKHFIPLESNPDLFTELIHRLGLSSDFIPRPALALVLVFPTTATYDEHTRDEEQSIEDYAKSGSQEEVMWYKQTINNACGLYGILHAVSNGDAKDYVGTYKRSARINRIANSESGQLQSFFLLHFVPRCSVEG